MTISVLMSTYRKEKPEYLDEAMKSIWSDQIRKPDEIVLVEDGPLTCDLDSVITKWSNILGDKLNIVKKDQNEGLASALNAGIAIAKGELIARMDSDDLSLPERFLLQERYMMEHEETDILGGAIEEFNDKGTLKNIRIYPATMKDVLNTMYRVSPVAHPTTIFRRRVFDNGIKYSSKYHLCEDVTMWYDAAEAHYIINNIPDVILLFRRNDSMLNRRSHEKAWNEFLAYNDGIYRVYGLFTYKYFYSFLRMIFRLLPSNIVKRIYNSKFRIIVAKQKSAK
jgi:glycosyltransferase involved in cell wall biosynthesis